MQGVDLFITITDRSRAEQFAAWFRTHGISLVLTALGQGTATTEVLDFLGLEATEKAVLFCVSPRSPRLVRQAARDLWLDVPGQGVQQLPPRLRRERRHKGHREVVQGAGLTKPLHPAAGEEGVEPLHRPQPSEPLPSHLLQPVVEGQL